MTTSPSDRAKEIMAWLRQECSDAICAHLDCPSCGCMAYLAAAITQAENEKLEEAAKSLTARILDYEDSDADPEFDVTDTVVAYELRQARDEIRSLKTPKD